MKKHIILISLVLNIFFLAQIQAHDYLLFSKDGNFSRNYEEILQEMTRKEFQEEDRIYLGSTQDPVLGNQDNYIPVKKFLGKGKYTAIFSLGDGKAIRLSLLTKKKELLSNYMDGYSTLERTELPVPFLYKKESKRDRFLIVEEIPLKYTLDSFLQAITKEPNKFSLDDLKKYFFPLLDFIKKSAVIDFGEDLHAGQYAFHEEKRQWLLMDIDQILLYRNFNLQKVLEEKHQRDHSIFRGLKGNLADLIDKILKVERYKTLARKNNCMEALPAILDENIEEQLLDLLKQLYLLPFSST